MNNTRTNALPAFFSISSVHQRWLYAAIALTLPFLVYLSTIAPTVWWLDSAELTTGAYTLGIVHAPGSPLFLCLGHLFIWLLPLGDVGYRVNLMTACSSALAALFMFLVVAHLTGRRPLALATALFTAFGFYVWNAAVAAELYSLQGCFVVGLLFLALKWREQQRPWQLCALAFLFGLGTGNHLSLVLLLPGYALLALATPLPWRQPRWLAAGVLCGFLGGLIWLYLPLRYAADPIMNYARIWGVPLDTWHGFWWMVTGQMFDSLYFSVPWVAMPGRVLHYLYELWSNFFGIGMLFAAWGLIEDSRRRPLINSALALMFIGHLVFFLPYDAPDEDTMLLPSYLIWAIWCGLGVYHIERRLAEHSLTRLATTLLFLLALSMLAFNYPRANLHNNSSARDRGERIFSSLQPRAVFIGSWIDTPILEYLQIVDSQRPDVTLVNALFKRPREQADIALRALATGRPVYTSIRGFLGDRSFYVRRNTDCTGPFYRCGLRQLSGAQE